MDDQKEEIENLRKQIKMVHNVALKEERERDEHENQ